MYIEYKYEAHMVFPLEDLPSFVQDHLQDKSVYFREFASYIVFRDKKVNKKEPLYACYVNNNGVLIYPSTGTMQDYRGIYLQFSPDEELDHIAANIGLTPQTPDLTDYPFVNKTRGSKVYQHIRRVPPADIGSSSQRPHLFLVDGIYYRTSRDAANVIGIDASLVNLHAQDKDKGKGKYIYHYSHIWVDRRTGIQHEAYIIEQDDPRYQIGLKTLT